MSLDSLQQTICSYILLTLKICMLYTALRNYRHYNVISKRNNFNYFWLQKVVIYKNAISFGI